MIQEEIIEITPIPPDMGDEDAGMSLDEDVKGFDDDGSTAHETDDEDF
jgi:hypothetical protein